MPDAMFDAVHVGMLPIRVEKTSRLLWRGDDIRAHGICDPSQSKSDHWVVSLEEWVMQMAANEPQKTLPRKFAERGEQHPPLA